MRDRPRAFIEKQANRIEKYLLSRRNEWVPGPEIASDLVLDWYEVKQALELLQERGIIAYGMTGDIRIRPNASRPDPILEGPESIG